MTRTSTRPGWLGVSDTVYVCAPARHQALAAPLVVGFLEQVRDGAYAPRPLRGRGVRRPPVLLALDEVANIAPLPDLPADRGRRR